ncbi:hypothetical protein D3C78_1527580 [compost metagenome]
MFQGKIVLVVDVFQVGKPVAGLQSFRPLVIGAEEVHFVAALCFAVAFQIQLVAVAGCARAHVPELPGGQL